MFVVLDRDLVRHVPMADHAGLQTAGDCGDAVLLSFVDVPLDILQAGIGAGGDAQADAGCCCRALSDSARRACAGDAGHVRCRCGQD